jgi:hypothetical protein
LTILRLTLFAILKLLSLTSVKNRGRRWRNELLAVLAWDIRE